MNIKVTVLVSIIFVILAYSCRQEQQIANSKTDKLINNWTGRIFFFPDSIIVLDSEKVSKMSQNEYVKTSYKIISVISPSCPGCIISEVMFWYYFYNNNLELNNFQLIIVYSGKKDYLIELINELQIDIEVVFDENGIIQKENNILLNPSYQTLLVDDNNKICLLGNIIGNKDMEILYLNKLRDKLNSN